MGPPETLTMEGKIARPGGTTLTDNDGRDEEARDSNDEGDNLVPRQPEKGTQSWEQRFQDIQYELSHMKEVVKGRAPVSMDALVQQMESLFTARVLHFPLPTKFRMP